MNPRLTIWVWGVLFLVGIALGPHAHAEGAECKASGQIVEVEADHLGIESQNERIRFLISDHVRSELESLQIGERVTVVFAAPKNGDRIAREILGEAREELLEPGQEPGTAPEGLPGIIDDRAFYPA
jgi:hypothetical protein